MNIKALFPIHCTGLNISHIALSLVEGMIGNRLDLRLWVPSSESRASRPYLKEALPRPLWKLGYRIGRTDWVKGRTEERYLKSLRPGDLAYVFPGASLALLRRVKERGIPLIIERINCADVWAKPILDTAYRFIGEPGCASMTSEVIARENEFASLGDRLFSPSPLVTRSLVESGISAERILESSYGWCPRRIDGTHRALPAIDGLTVLFVGSIGVRKGANLLLESWARSGVKGRLVLAGRIEPIIADRCQHLLNRPDVVRLGQVADVGAYFRSADVFAFPTHEEGSPLVTYEAMASGLPLVISPMGAGAVARDGQEAIVLDPYDIQAWAEAFRRMADDADFRRTLGANARRRAEDFTWQKVGARRRDLLLRWMGTPAERQVAMTA